MGPEWQIADFSREIGLSDEALAELGPDAPEPPLPWPDEGS
jgi:hypothetical protein